MAAKTNEWRLAVARTIGGSSAGASIGRGRYMTRRQLWDRMVKARDGLLDPSIETDDMRRGRLFEDGARQAVSELLGVKIDPHDQNEFLTNPAYPFAHCLPDGWLPDGGALELKVVRPTTFARVGMNGPFPEWQIQCLHNLTVAHAPYTLLAVVDCVTTRVEMQRVEPDGVFIDALMRGEADFFRLVETRTPPQEDDPPAPDLDASEDRSGMVTITDADAIRAAESYARCKALADEAAELSDDAKVRLATRVGCELERGKLLGGPHAFEVVGVGRFYHRPQAGRRMFDADAAKKDFPQLNDPKYLKSAAPSRPFRAYFAHNGD